ncbi:MAG: sulfide/dihydroorotate dehydrogenase-like FAD/NAD-binding protein [Myxococcales bacterium]|jgi:ferredoxin--NADP+ reductase|nr:sulfide/dihydroorotate dehydrogenase-like FAD/NAD-binding protein [Myxococcales bacterium]
MNDNQQPTGTLLDKKELAPKVHRYVFRAPDIARRRKPGQFVIVRTGEGGERIPLTIADADSNRGTVTLVVQEVGRTTAEMARALEPGMKIADLVGPLGTPTHIEKYGRVVVVGGGIGVAPVHPIAQAMKAAGNEVIAVIGARTKELIIMEDEMRAASSRLVVMTDDGSYGAKGFVTDAVKAEAEKGKIDLVVAIGPVPMMRAVSNLTRELGIPTMVSLNPIMIDGTGMCGGCRVSVGGETKFVCVDGPEFDGHKVDFDELVRRQRFYAGEEKSSHETFVESHTRDPKTCKLLRLADDT